MLSRIQAMKLQAMSLNVPSGTFTNRLPVSGILTFCDVISTNAPEGTGGKRIILQRAAAERALAGLLGSPIGLADDMQGHARQNRIGVITSANLQGNGAIAISGHLFCSDYPLECARIQRDKAALGWSFEAEAISVLDMAADVLTLTGLQFSGVAVLKRSHAAYEMTSLAASKDTSMTQVTIGGERTVGTNPPDPILMRAMLKVGIEASSIGGSGRLSMAQLDKITATTDSISGRMQLTRLAELAGLLPVELQSGPRSPALASF